MRLERKYEGPCPILRKVGKASYKIDIPSWMKIHPVITVSNLQHEPNTPEDQLEPINEATKNQKRF